MSLCCPRALPPQPRVFLTGAGGGLGRALALNLAAQRARLWLSDVHAERLAETAQRSRAAGAEVHTAPLDVTDAQAVAAAADAAWARWGGLDLVINNAGVACGGNVGEVSLEDWRWVLDINLMGVIYGCHAFAPKLRAQGHGAILNVASAAGIASLPTMGPYNVGKAGVIALSETLHAELGAVGVGVTVLCPTFFATHLQDSLRVPDERTRELAAGLFSLEHGTAQTVAQAALGAVRARRLYVLPQHDAKLVWWSKRLAPNLFYRALALQQRTGITDRLLRFKAQRLARGRP